jgi:acyl-CoA thioesterase FadM
MMDAAAAAAPDGAQQRPASATFSIELAVRDYELDQFGVVNNAVYANYAEHGAVLRPHAQHHATPQSNSVVSWILDTLLAHIVRSVTHEDTKHGPLISDILRVARHEFLAHIGIDAHLIARDGDALALAEQTIRFLAPLRSR